MQAVKALVRHPRSTASDLCLRCLRVSKKRTLGLYGLIMITCIFMITNLITVYGKNNHFKQAFTCNMFKNIRNIQHLYK